MGMVTMRCRLCGKEGHQDARFEWWHDGPPVYHLFRPDIARKAVEGSPDLPPPLVQCNRCKAWIALDDPYDTRGAFYYHRSRSLCDEKLRYAPEPDDVDMWTPEAAL